MLERLSAFLHRGPYAAAVRVALLGLAAVVICAPLSYFFSWVWFALIPIIIAGLLFVSIVLLNRSRAKLDDTSALIGLEFALRRLDWAPPDFYTDGAAGSPSLQLFHVKVLTLVKPQSILELGSGQTTKLISAYVGATSGAYALSIEQSPEWHGMLRSAIGHNYEVAPLVTRKIEGVDVLSYDVQLKGPRKFDYVLVDGPDNNVEGWRYTPFSRAGIVDELPDVLADSFIVVFDDAERAGERQTIELFARKLAAKGTPFRRFTLIGIKHQAVFVSPSLAFLQSV
ncbi:MAG: hypothetical protein AB7F71_21930 [Burkholderiaceae bacterium]